MSRLALIPDRLFDGRTMREDVCVVIEDGRVAALRQTRDAPAGARRLAGLLAPGFIDVQVNGGGGALLNDDPSAECMATIARAHRRFGVTGLLPTLITDAPEKAALAMAAARDARARKIPGVLGVHLEGPFLNPARKGVHDPAFMRAPDEADLAVLTAPTGGLTHVTLAPECVAPGVIGRLAHAGVVVSAGHTEATAERLDEARAEGLTGYTHLYNAMPPMAGRAPGPVGAALSERETFCGLIVDRHHVGAHALKAAIAAKGFERAMLVSDAMSTVGSDLHGFDLQGRWITRADGRLTAADGTLAGSDLDMATAVRNCVEWLGLPLEAALAMASATPAMFLGLSKEIGFIAQGARADLVLLDDDLCVVTTWIAGREPEQSP